MKIKFIALGLFAGALLSKASAQSFVIEPDNYTGAILDHICPQVSLTTAGLSGAPQPGRLRPPK